MLHHGLQLLAGVPLVSLLVVVTTAWLLRRRPGRARPAWLVAFVAVLSAADAVDDLPLPAEPDARSASHTVEVGFAAGSYQTCAGPRTWGGGGAMYRYQKPVSAQTDLTLAAGAFVGADGADPFGGGRAEIGVEHRWAGGAVGVVAGSLHRESTLTTPVLPTARLRLGPRDMVFADASVFAMGPTPIPGSLLEAGAGVAFPRLGNRWEPFQVRAGLSLSGIYLSPTIPLGQVGNLDLFGAYGDPDTWGVTTRVRVHFPADADAG